MVYHIGYQLAIGTKSGILDVHDVKYKALMKGGGKIRLAGKEYEVDVDCFYRRYARMASRLWLVKGVKYIAFYKEGVPQPLRPFNHDDIIPRIPGEAVSSWFKSKIFSEVFAPEPNWMFILVGIMAGIGIGAIALEIVQRSVH